MSFTPVQVCGYRDFASANELFLVEACRLVFEYRHQPFHWMLICSSVHFSLHVLLCICMFVWCSLLCFWGTLRPQHFVRWKASKVLYFKKQRFPWTPFHSSTSNTAHALAQGSNIATTTFFPWVAPGLQQETMSTEPEDVLGALRPFADAKGPSFLKYDECDKCKDARVMKKGDE